MFLTILTAAYFFFTLVYFFKFPATFPFVVELKLTPVVCHVSYTDDDSFIAIEISVDQIFLTGETKVVAVIQQCIAVISYTIIMIQYRDFLKVQLHLLICENICLNQLHQFSVQF